MSFSLRMACALLLFVSAAAGQDNGPRSMRLQPGDRIVLRIFREADLSAELNVPITGVVVFPRIGPRKVTGLTTATLQDSIIKEYRAFLRDWVSIDLVFQRRVTVLGAVRAPGIVFVDETMTVAEALALAGGVEPHGRSDQIKLYRGDEVVHERVTRRTPMVELSLQSGDQLFVPDKNWLARNTPIVAALVSGLVSVAVAVLVQKN